MFRYFESDDLAATKTALEESDANKRWGKFMDPIMKIEIDPSIQFL